MNTKLTTLKTELREFIELSKTIEPNWVIKSSQREIGNSGDFETETFIEDIRGFCVTNGWNLEERDERNFAFIARSRNISPALAECLLLAVDALEHEDISNHAKLPLQQILNIWEAAK